MPKINCPDCGKRVDVNHTKFDAWGFPYEFTNCTYCEAAIIYKDGEVKMYSEYFEEVLDDNI